MSEQVSTLVRDELKLAQLEMTHKGKQAGIGAGMMGGGGVIAPYGLGCLIACAIIAISRVLAPWLSALIVGAALLAVAGIVALTGRARLRRPSRRTRSRASRPTWTKSRRGHIDDQQVTFPGQP